jgi:rhamnulokinase
MAARAKSLRSLINVDEPCFHTPPDMVKAIQKFCRDTGQPVPRTEGELVRCACESMALKYHQVLGGLEELSGERVEVLHIVGGGSQNELLNQLAADACQRPVLAGPVEATALGNLLVQVRASGELSSLAEIRQVIRQSSRVREYLPRSSAAWKEAAARFSAEPIRTPEQQ